MKHNPLLEDLRHVFPPEPLSSHDAFLQRGIAYCDGEEYMQKLEGRTWEQLDPQYFARRSDALSFLGDAHLAALLPLYLHLMLVFVPWSPVPESLLPVLTRPEPTDEPSKLYDWRKRRFEGFTPLLTADQKRVVALALRQFAADAPREGAPAVVALDRYWAAFEHVARESTSGTSTDDLPLAPRVTVRP